MDASPINVALLSAFPATELLPETMVKPRYRGREHPASWVRALSGALSERRDIRATVLVDSRAVSRERRARMGRVEFVFLPKIEPLRMSPYHLHVPQLLRFRRRLSALNADIVHGFGTEGGNGLCAVLLAKRHVLTVQGIRSELHPFKDAGRLKKRLWVLLERYAVRRARVLVCQSEFGRAWVERVNPLARLFVMPNAVNTEFLHVKPTFSEKKLLCVGALSRTKGTDTILRAFSRCRKEAGERLVFLGASPALSEYRRMADRCGLSHHVTFSGQVCRDDLLEEMRTARGIVLGSRMDTSPNVITEAHAAGLPVIATRAGGIPDLVEHGKDGFLAAVEDAEDLAGKMRILFENPSLCAQLGHAGRAKVSVANDPDRIAGQHVEMYKELARAQA